MGDIDANSIPVIFHVPIFSNLIINMMHLSLLA